MIYVIALLFLGVMVAAAFDKAHGHERSDYAECIIASVQPNGMAIMKHSSHVLEFCANLKEEQKDD